LTGPLLGIDGPEFLTATKANDGNDADFGTWVDAIGFFTPADEVVSNATADFVVFSATAGVVGGGTSEVVTDLPASRTFCSSSV
jgi:hypothetical protein